MRPCIIEHNDQCRLHKKYVNKNTKHLIFVDSLNVAHQLSWVT